MKRSRRIALALASTALSLELSATAQEVTGKAVTPLTISDVQNWTVNQNVVPVCWETPGYDREKAITKAAVAGTWEYFANVRFLGWGACPSGGIGGSSTEKQVRIHIDPHDTTDAGAGGWAAFGMGALSSANGNGPGVKLSFNPDGSADQGRVEYIAVHEFGHVLGFIHEQDAPGNEGPAKCPTKGVDKSATPLTAYDRDSVMNYCNRDLNMKGNLTDSDIIGVQAIYGVRVANLPARNSCASTPTKETSSVEWGWNDGSGLASFALFQSTKKAFEDRAVWNVRQGGWMDDAKWFAGDFNGDKKTDIGAVWNNGGLATLTVRQSTGSSFGMAHWAVKTGAFIDKAVWLPGDYNKDGFTDVAGVWNDGGKVSIAMFLSDGTKFVNQSPQWSVKEGGWMDNVKWFAGDFDRDGRTDIGAAWNNGGRTTLTVRRSTGSKFTHNHWLADAGPWSDASVFLAADFDKDGSTDVARLWNDLGLFSAQVYHSDRKTFWSPSDWSVRDGGWIQGNRVKWFAGDFNGDGRADVGAAWDNDHLNTLTIRQAVGTSFVQSHWASKAGGWRDSATWCVGQFK